MNMSFKIERSLYQERFEDIFFVTNFLKFHHDKVKILKSSGRRIQRIKNQNSIGLLYNNTRNRRQWSMPSKFSWYSCFLILNLVKKSFTKVINNMWEYNKDIFIHEDLKNFFPMPPFLGAPSV